MRTVDSQT